MYSIIRYMHVCMFVLTCIGICTQRMYIFKYMYILFWYVSLWILIWDDNVMFAFAWKGHCISPWPLPISDVITKQYFSIVLDEARTFIAEVLVCGGRAPSRPCPRGFVPNRRGKPMPLAGAHSEPPCRAAAGHGQSPSPSPVPSCRDGGHPRACPDVCRALTTLGRRPRRKGDAPSGVGEPLPHGPVPPSLCCLQRLCPAVRVWHHSQRKNVCRGELYLLCH